MDKSHITAGQWKPMDTEEWWIMENLLIEIDDYWRKRELNHLPKPGKQTLGAEDKSVNYLI